MENSKKEKFKAAINPSVGNYTKVLSDMLNAYSDCNSQSTRPRTLDFKSELPVNTVEAYHIMTKSLKDINGTYNDFNVELLKLLPENSEIYLAREGSVCIYVSGKLDIHKSKLKANEFNYYENINQTRIWWD